MKLSGLEQKGIEHDQCSGSDRGERMMGGLRWHGPDDTLQVGEFRLKGPLCYSDTARKSDEPSAITVNSLVAPPKDTRSFALNGFSCGYHYEGYSRLGLQGRWRYLDWLKREKPLPWDEDGLLLFLKGLERRVIADRRDAELIWKEIWRLWHGCDESCYSFRHSAERFLWYLLPQVAETATNEQAELLSLSLHSISWNPDSERYLSLWLCWCVRQSGQLPFWAAYRCARLLHGASHSVVAQRAEPDLKFLFETRFKDRWGEAVPLPLPAKARRSLDYEPLNYLLRPATVTWPDPMKQPSHWPPLALELMTLYNGCQDELRPLGLVLGKAGVTRESPAAWEAMPKELRRGDNPAVPKLRELTGGSLSRSGFVMATVGEVAAIFSVPERASLSSEVSKRLAVSVQTCGISIEPDSRLIGKGYCWSDSVVLFDPKEDVLPEFGANDTARYQACAFLLKSAFYVTQAGGEVDGVALSLIGNSVFGLFAEEPSSRRRFMALATLLKVSGVDWAAVRVPSSWPAEAREGAGRLLLQLVQLDRRISAAEESALRAVWKRLGLDAKSLNRALDALSAEGVIFIGELRQSGVGEQIPPSQIPPSVAGSAPAADFALDKAAIAALLADTHKVQQALMEAMTVDDGINELCEMPHSTGNSLKHLIIGEPVNLDSRSISSEAVDEAAAPVEEDARGLLVVVHGESPDIQNGPPLVAHAEGDPHLEGLAPRYVPFAKALFARDRWKEGELKRQAAEQRVMLSGAIEAINAWAFETLGEQLLWEDGDVWKVERSLLDVCS